MTVVLATAGRRRLLSAIALARLGSISRHADPSPRGIAVWLLSNRLECVGQGPGGLRDRRIGRHEIGQAVARAGPVEALDSDVEGRPQLLRATSPVPGRSSYGGRARSDPSIGRHASPASSARACVSRIASAASDNARRRPRKPAWAARAHATASRLPTRTGPHAPRPRRRPWCRRDGPHGAAREPRSPVVPTAPSGSSAPQAAKYRAAARTFRKNLSVVKNHRRTHTALLM